MFTIGEGHGVGVGDEVVCVEWVIVASISSLQLWYIYSKFLCWIWLVEYVCLDAFIGILNPACRILMNVKLLKSLLQCLITGRGGFKGDVFQLTFLLW